jgi:UDP-N-acetylmuramyl tripeptide synthase
MPAIRWFAYNFPNRRSEKPVIEVTLDFTPADRHDQSRLRQLVHNVLLSSGILEEHEVFPAQTLPDEWIGGYTSLLVQTALLFQQKAGHPVSFFSVSCPPDQNRRSALVEHQHGDVGLTAVKLAVEVLGGQRKELSGPFKAFKQFALERLIPIDTRAIIAAAHRCDIPTVLLERLPYKREDFHELTKGECIRQHGLVMLGHGRFQLVLDGTFCLDKSSKYNDLRTEGDKRLVLLKELGLPLANPEKDSSFTQEYHLVIVNGQVTAVINTSNNDWMAPTVLDESLTEQVLKVNCEVDFAPIIVRILASDNSLPITLAGCRVIDFVLAPALDRYLDSTDDHQADKLASTADLIIDWLFHDNKKVRMPIIAVTGTNGKTTTTRMISRILTTAGRKPGMVCSNGVYLNNQEILKGDQGTVGGHLEILNNKDAKTAVLETHHNGILKNGFAFSWCDVAVCLNVTEDHIGHENIDTVEQMAEVKRALIERARHAVVLNADNAHCLDMIEFANAELICMVSMQRTAGELLLQLGNRSGLLCVLELIDNEQWLVIHDGSCRIPVMSVASIPMTFNGVAVFNTSNAMHAILAAYLLDIRMDVITKAMGAFNAGYENTPGRMNIFDDLPFRVIMDFAHNPDGMHNLNKFVDAQAVTGRKILAFAGPADRTDEALKKLGRTVAGHYNFYFCKEYVPRFKGTPRKTNHILQQGLLESGVNKELTATVVHGKQVIFEIFDSCAPGDLLVILVGQIEQNHLPGYVTEYAKKLIAMEKNE